MSDMFHIETVNLSNHVEISELSIPSLILGFIHNQ